MEITLSMFKWAYLDLPHNCELIKTYNQIFQSLTEPHTLENYDEKWVKARRPKNLGQGVFYFKWILS